MPFSPQPADHARIQRAILYLVENTMEQPDLSKLAEIAGVSEFHFQRVFQLYAGVTPKSFLQFLTIENAKSRLKSAPDLFSVARDVGLSGTGRLHDLFIKWEAMTPGQFQRGEITIYWAILPTLFGDALFSATERGLCGLSFVMAGENPIQDLQARWQGASFLESPDRLQPYADALDARWRGEPQPISLFLKGTPFQIKVWEALLRIPAGELTTYQTLANAAASPGASRAVGTAMASNPIGVFIPCHRVIRGTGVIGQYRWGTGRKRALLALEAAQTGVK